MDDSAELVTVWNRARPRFDDPSIRPQQKAWIGLTRPLGLVEDTALLAAPNDFAKDYLENRLRPLIASVLSEELGRDIRVAVTVQAPETAGGAATPRPSRAPTVDRSAPRRHGDRRRRAADGATTRGPTSRRPPTTVPHLSRASTARPTGRATPTTRSIRDARLNPKYTFDTFVIGSSNRFTHAAAVAVAEAPARAYNPLFIYGDSGLGKTHLLHAIGHYARRLQPEPVDALRVERGVHQRLHQLGARRQDAGVPEPLPHRSTSCSSTTSSSSSGPSARRRSSSTPSTRCTTRTSRSSSAPTSRPRQLNSLEDRLRTRFEWGLISDVQAPDLETRIAILRKKAAQEGMSPPPEVLEFIASKIQSNIRELEGALIRVTAFASLNHQVVELGLAEMVLKDLVGENDAPEISARHDHGRHRRVLLGHHRRPRRQLAQPGARRAPARWPCTCAASSPTCRCPRSARSSAAATTPPSCTPSARSARR